MLLFLLFKLLCVIFVCVAKNPLCYKFIIESNEKGELLYEETPQMETLSK